MPDEPASGRTALLVVDVQNDFCEGGSLAVSGGEDAAAAVARHLDTRSGRYVTVAATRDWHVHPGDHFASAQGKTPDFVDTWPDHCVAGTDGAAFHPAVRDAIGRVAEGEFRKGERRAAYSGFDGTLGGDARTSLVEWLRRREVDSVVVVGIATDYCVRATALDAVRSGLRCTVLLDLCAGVDPVTTDAACVAMRAAGVELRRDAGVL